MSEVNPYAARPAARPPAGGGPQGLADVLERVLDKGLVIAGDISLSLVDVEVLTIKVRLLLASADTAQQMGIDWWKTDPFLSSQARAEEDEASELRAENRELRGRLDRLERVLAAALPAESDAEHGAQPGMASRRADQWEVPDDALAPRDARDDAAEDARDDEDGGADGAEDGDERG